MRNIILLIAIIMLTASTTSREISIFQEESFTFSGEIEGYGDGIIHISFSDPFRIIKDSIMVENDRFEYKGVMECPKMAFMRIMGNENLKKEYHRIDFFMDHNSHVKLEISLDDLKNHKIIGSKSNDEYQSFVQDRNSVNQAYIKARNDQREKRQDAELRPQLEAEVERTREAYIANMMEVENFSTSHIMAYTLWLSSKHIPLDRIREITPHFDSSLENNVYLKYLVDKIEGEDSVEPGARAADFMVKDVDGNDYTINDFKGNYLMIAFSASWCTWCKKEYPYLKEAYEKYSDKGLQIVILNLDDTREKWVKDVEKENLPWPVLSDLNAFKGELTKKYSVRAIPRIFLVDPQGKIVANSLRGNNILNLLESEYKSQ